MNSVDEMIMRMKILLDGEIISEQIYQDMLLAISYLENYNLDFDRENTFITHLAMALSRIEAESIEEGLATEILEQVKASKCYGVASEILAELKKIINLEIPEAEEGYLLIHISNMLDIESGV